MATIDVYKIKVEVSGDRDVKKLQDDVDSLTDKLESASTAALGFATAAAAAFTAVAVDAFKMADSLVDVAGGVGMATSKVYQLALAAEASGGQFDDAAKLLGKFGQSIDMAAKGSQIMQDDLAKLGISLEDLRTLSAEELFNKAVQGAADLGGGLDATATAMAVFGKAAREINFPDLIANMSKNGAESETAAALMEKAAGAAGKIEVAYRNLQIVALQVFEPVLDALNDLEGTHKKVRDIVIKLGTAFAALAGLGVAMTFIRMATAAIQFARAVSAVVASTTVLVGLTGVGLVAVGAAVAAGTAAYLGLSAAIDDVAEGIGDTKDSTNDTKDALDALNKTAEDGGEKTKTITRDIVNLNKQQLEAAKAKTQQLQTQIDNANQLRRKTLELIGTETNLANLKKANLNAESQAKNQIAAIEAQINTELGKGIDANQDVVIELRNQQGILQRNLETTKALNEEEYKRLRIQREYAEVSRAFQAYNSMVYSDLVDKAKEDVLLARAKGEITREQGDLLLNLASQELAHADKIQQLEQQQRDAAAESNQELVDNLQNQINLENERWERKKEHLEKEYDLQNQISQSAKAGAIEALDQIAQGMEPFQLAQDAVLSMWGNIGSAIDNLVDTGKASFSDFAKSIIKDLTKMILKAMLFKYVFEPIMGKFGLSIPGRANGGPVGAGQPYMVGERGPELFVPKQAGEIIPNNKLGSASTGAGVVNAPVTNNYITNNINALDSKSVAQVFAENRKTLLGTVQMAQKEMPYSR